MKRILLSFFVLILSERVSLGLGRIAPKRAAPSICYRCDEVADPMDCKVTETCMADQQCFTNKFISTEGHAVFTLGCQQERICSILATLGKRDLPEVLEDNPNVINLCTQCCSSGYCNNKLCTTTTTPLPVVKCHTCNLEEDPNSCVNINSCKEGEVCFADVWYNNNGDIRHRLGCRPKRMCDAFLKHGAGFTHGKRETNLQTCGGCCESNGCNLGGCYSIPHYNLTHAGK